MSGYGRSSAYQATQVSTANRVKLVVLMYDGAIRFITAAKEKSIAGDLAGKGLAISRAQRIIHELSNALDVQRGGEVAAGLSQVYLRISNNLINANISGDLSGFDESLESLRSLRGAWEQIMQKPALAESAPPVSPKMGGRVAISL